MTSVTGLHRPLAPAYLVSVNVGQPRPDKPARRGDPPGLTAIDKRPTSGPVEVRAPGPRQSGLGSGLAGDAICNRRYHGGDDQAVYAYAREDLDGWAAELGRPLASGGFGENLTTSGIDVNGARIGERWRVGQGGVVLEVSLPRVPCRTFAGFMDEPGWVKRFTQRGLPGAYLRVIQPGRLQVGDPVEIVDRPAHDVTVALVFRALTLEPELMARLAVASALPARVLDEALAAAQGEPVP
jgi:MOSC domain-containing protein YiiM